MKDIKIIVATHKDYPMPKDSIYMPLEVGVDVHGKKTNFTEDNSGDNISGKNSGYSELTGLYWAWKNLKSSYAGLAHYRRHFATHGLIFSKPEKRLKKVLDVNDADDLLGKYDVILPKARNYYIENLYDHYVHTMYPEPLEITKEIIEKHYPEYMPEFEKLKTRKTAHMFNMLIAKKDIFDGYAEWLFDILFRLEKEVEKRGLKYDDFHARFYGRISELLLDIYLNTNNISYTELPVFSVEPVNWLNKGSKFLQAKFLKKKYMESF